MKVGWIDINNSRTLDDGDYTGWDQLSTLGQTEVSAFVTMNIHSARTIPEVRVEVSHVGAIWVHYVGPVDVVVKG